MYINFSPSKPFKSGAPSLSSTSKIQFSSQRVNETFQKVKTPVSKNVLLVTDSWSPQIDGLATTAKNLAKNLRINGHNVLVIHPYLFPNIPSPSGYPGARLTFPKGLNTKIKNFKPDWAINLTPEYSLGIMSSAILKRNKIPYVTAYTTKQNQARESSRLKIIPQRWINNFVRWSSRNAIGTLVATDTLKQDLERQGYKNILSWTRGVDTEQFSIPPLKETSDLYAGLPKPICLMVSRAAYEKNIESFLNLNISSSDQPGKKATLVFVGDGPALKRLKKAYPKDKYPHILFKGAKKGEELAKHYAGADVFVFPSMSETFGVVMIESLAAGTPVIGLPATGPLDLNRKNPFLVRIAPNSLGLENKVKETVQDLQSGKLTAEQCRQFVLENYTAQICADKLERALNQAYSTGRM